MANSVEIILQGVDKASSVINKVEKEVNQLSKTGTGATSVFGKLGPAIGSAFAAAGGVYALVSAGKAIKGLADDFQDYALQVEDFGRKIGATPEEASKLIQVADDVRVSVGSLETAMRSAIMRGYVPTIDNLKKMSDAYLAIQDPIERSKYLLDTFGRSGLEMAKIMELGSEKITEMGDSIEGTGLLMTKEGIAKAKEYHAAMDTLGDTVEALKMTLGSDLAPSITIVANEMNKSVQLFEMGVDAVYRYIAVLKDGKITQSEYNKLIADGYTELYKFMELTGLTTTGLLQEKTATEQTTGAINRLDDSTQQYIDNAGGLVGTLEEVSDSGYAAASGIYAVSQAWNKLSRLDMSLGSKIQEQLDQIKFEDLGLLLLQQQFEALQTNIKNGLIDPATEGKDILKDLLVKWETLQIAAGAETKWDALENLKNSGQFAKEELDAIWQMLQKLDGKVVNSYVNIWRSTKDAGTGGGGPGGASYQQFGGPVYAGKPYIVGEVGPELFVPSTNGQIVSNDKLDMARGDIYMNINTQPGQSSEAIAYQVIAMLNSRQGLARSAGRGYAGAL